MWAVEDALAGFGLLIVLVAVAVIYWPAALLLAGLTLLGVGLLGSR